MKKILKRKSLADIRSVTRRLLKKQIQMEIPVQGLDPAPPLSENKEEAKAAAETAALLEEATE